MDCVGRKLNLSSCDFKNLQVYEFKLSKVIIGANFDEKTAKYKDLQKAVHTYQDLSIYKCVLSSTKYQIELKRIYDNTMFTYYLDRNEYRQEDLVGAL